MENYDAISTSWVLIRVSAFTILLPLISGLLRHKALNKRLTFLLAYLLVAGVYELAFIFLASRNINNMPLSFSFIVIEFTFLALVYYHTFISSGLKKLVLFLLVLFSLFAIINAFFIQGLYAFNSNSRSLECVLLMIIGFIYFYTVFTELNIPRIEKHPMFWVNSGILIYFSGNLFLFILFDYISVDKEYYYDKWVIHSLLNIFINLFFAVGLWLSPQKQISLSY